MEYQTLYRKYRPNNFDDVVGQKVVVDTLKNAIKNNKISHAYIFCGPRGTGKTSIAKIFAKTVNCENSIEGTSCEKCNTCNMYNAQESSDIIEIDAASNNGVDEIRELRNNSLTLPSSSKYKVYIIDEVHMLSTSAFNAFLKTLEEPPAHVIFILATTEIHKVPLTILSRCQRFNFENLSLENVVNRLTYISEQEKISITKDALNQIASLGKGALRDSIGLLDQMNSYKKEEITAEDVLSVKGEISKNKIKEFVKNISNCKIDTIFNDINSFYEKGNNFLKITEQILYYLKDILFESKISTENELQLRIDEIFKMIDIVNNVLIIMKDCSDYKVQFEILVLKLCSIFNAREKRYNDELSQEKINLQTPSFSLEKVDKNISDTKTEKVIIENNVKVESISNISFIEKTKIPDLVLDKTSETRLVPSNLREIFSARIHNTLIKANKSKLTELKKYWSNMESDLIMNNLKKLVPILIDSEVCAASEDSFIISFLSSSEYEKAIEEYNTITDFFRKKYNENFNISYIINDEWIEKRKQYVEKIKKGLNLEFLEEPNPLYKKEDSSLNVFEELLEIERG